MRFSTRLFCIVLFGFIGANLHAQLTRQWTARYAGDNKTGVDAASALTTDDSGYAYITGYSNRKTSGSNIVTVKYAPTGARLWVATYAGSGSAGGKAIAVDSGYNVYVLASIDSGGTTNYLTIKYNRSGAPLWMRMYDGPGHGEDQPVGIAVNDSLNVYVTGYSTGAGTGFDYATVKYNKDGTLMWEKRLNGRLNGDDKPTAMWLTGNSALYVTGSITDTLLDYATIKYLPTSGDSLWMAQYNGPASGNDVARAISIGASNNVYVTGGSQGVGTGYDYATIKYNSSGEVQWISRYNGGANGDDQALALAVYSSTRVYVTGHSLNTGSFYDIVTVSYNASTGDEQWVSSYNGTGNDDDTPVAASSGNNFYVLGTTTSANDGKDFVLLKYQGSHGALQWSGTYNNASYGFGDDVPSAMAVSGNSVYVTGRSFSGTTGVDYLTICYSDPNHLYYRSLTQSELLPKGVSIKNTSSVPNIGNVRDAAYAAAFPKIKKGYSGFPGGLLLGNARPDSATSFGWIRVTKSPAIITMVPATGPARGFISSEILGEKKDFKVTKYNNQLVGDLLALKVSIAASDAGVTPPTFGDLTYNDGDTSNHYNGMTLRQLAAYVDNVLTYSSRYPGVNYLKLDTMLMHVTAAFSGPFAYGATMPVIASGVKLIDSVTFLAPGATPLENPLQFEKGSLEEMPKLFTLYQNYPNPFNPTTTIEFDLSDQATVTLKVYDMLGREVATLLNHEDMEQGKQSVVFDANSATGGLASGVYFYRLLTEDGAFQMVKKMVFVR